MKNLLVLNTILLFAPCFLWSQSIKKTSTCYDLYIKEGEQALNQSIPNYNLAIRSFLGVLKCPNLTTEEKEIAIKKASIAFEKNNNFLENARTQAEVQGTRIKALSYALVSEKYLERGDSIALNLAFYAKEFIEGLDEVNDNISSVFRRAVFSKHHFTHVEGPDNIIDLKFAENGDLVFVASRNKSVKVLNSEKKVLVSQISKEQYIRTIDHSKDGSNFVFGTQDGEIDIYKSVPDQEVKKIKEHNGEVYFTSFSIDDSQIISGDDQGKVNLWSSTGDLISTLERHERRVYDGKFSRDGKKILTYGSDGKAIVWGTNGMFIAEFNIGQGIFNVQFAPDSKHIFALAPNRVDVWNLSGYSKQLSFEADSIYDFSFSKTGEFILLSGLQSGVKIWNWKENSLFDLSKDSLENIFLKGGVFSKQDNKLLVWSENELFLMENGALIRRFDNNSDTTSITKAKFSPNGAYLLVLFSDNSIILKNLEDEDIITITKHKTKVIDFMFSANSKAVLSYDKNGLIITVPIPEVIYEKLLLDKPFIPNDILKKIEVGG